LIHKLTLSSSFSSQTPAAAATATKGGDDDDDDDEVDLFGSDDEEEDAEAERVKAQRVADYNKKRAEKEAVKGKTIAKSVVTLCVKPWDDETDLDAMEKEVRALEQDGLIWGASKKVPVGYGVSMIQFTLVIEDDKVSERNTLHDSEFEPLLTFQLVLSFLLLRSRSKNFKSESQRLKITFNQAMLPPCKSFNLLCLFFHPHSPLLLPACLLPQIMNRK